MHETDSQKSERVRPGPSPELLLWLLAELLAALLELQAAPALLALLGLRLLARLPGLCLPLRLSPEIGLRVELGELGLLPRLAEGLALLGPLSELRLLARSRLLPERCLLAERLLLPELGLLSERLLLAELGLLRLGLLRLGLLRLGPLL